jgi:hypothetical protein
VRFERSVVHATATNRSTHRFAASLGGAIAVVLSLAALPIAFASPVAASVMGAIALAMGCWGLHGKRRGLATVGLLLACISLSISGLNGIVHSYTHIYGAAPWQAPPSDVLQ